MTRTLYIFSTDGRLLNTIERHVIAQRLGKYVDADECLDNIAHIHRDEFAVVDVTEHSFHDFGHDAIAIYKAYTQHVIDHPQAN